MIGRRLPEHHVGTIYLHSGGLAFLTFNHNHLTYSWIFMIDKAHENTRPLGKTVIQTYLN